MFHLTFNPSKRLTKRYHFQAIVLSTVVCATVLWYSPARSQEGDTPLEDGLTEQVEVPPAFNEVDPKAAVTTKNIDIPIDQLELLVQPLTIQELEQEAAAWMGILKAKVKEISTAEIAIKRQNAAISKQEESAEQLEKAKQALEEAQAVQANAIPGSPEYEEAAKTVEQAKENLAAAQDALEEAKEIKELSSEEGEESTTVLERAKKAGELQTAQEVLDRAKQEREQMMFGSLAYEYQTEKIDTLTEAIKAVENAEEDRQAEIPDTPEYEAATQQLEAARTTLKQAIEALDETALPQEEQQSPEQLDELSSTLENTEVIDGEEKVAGPPEVVASQQDLERQGQQLEDAADRLKEGSEEEAEAKNQLVVAVTELQEERTAIIDRFRVILNELDKKGGDTTFYRQYIEAVSTVELDIQDTEGLGVRLIGWMKSEEGGLRWTQNTATFFGVFIVAVIAAQIIGIGTNVALARISGVSQLFRQFLVMFIKRGGVLVAFLLALTALEVSLGPILALLGGVSFVLAFALQSNLGNLASGLMIMVYKPFDVGDEVKVNNLWGYIHSITLANTQIKGFDHQIITVPNNTIWGSIIENLTTQDIRRGGVPVSVSFDCDLRRVKQVLIEIGNSHPKTIKKPSCSAFIYKGSDYHVSTALKFWATADDYWTVYEDLTFMIQERFREEGISIAIPQQDVRLHHPTNGNDKQAVNSSQTYYLPRTHTEDKEERPMDEFSGDLESMGVEID
ncbi:MAG: mechanosensitive ion channel protein [Cyanobacteria bacterium J007]|nr:MAG: mechanosensitive ion channel protein [Cyanobacteria bacterium J007]